MRAVPWHGRPSSSVYGHSPALAAFAPGSGGAGTVVDDAHVASGDVRSRIPADPADLGVENGDGGDTQTIAEARMMLDEHLAALREGEGYSQKEFAPLTGFTRSTLANVETGRLTGADGFRYHVTVPGSQADPKRMAIMIGNLMAVSVGEDDGLPARASSTSRSLSLHDRQKSP